MNTAAKRIMTIAAASVLVGATALAAPPSQEITVTGTRLPNVKVVENSPHAFYREFRVSTTVSAAGLDLSAPSGAATLEQRVNDAALAVCQEITRLSPNATPDEPTCAKEAVKRVMVKVKSLESAAGLGK
jgi:UrcA family protein